MQKLSYEDYWDCFDNCCRVLRTQYGSTFRHRPRWKRLDAALSLPSSSLPPQSYTDFPSHWTCGYFRYPLVLLHLPTTVSSTQANGKELLCLALPLNRHTPTSKLTGQTGFLGNISFPPPCILELLHHTHLTSPTSALKISMFTATKISPLHSADWCVDLCGLVYGLVCGLIVVLTMMQVMLIVTHAVLIVVHVVLIVVHVVLIVVHVVLIVAQAMLRAVGPRFLAVIFVSSRGQLGPIASKDPRRNKSSQGTHLSVKTPFYQLQNMSRSDVMADSRVPHSPIARASRLVSDVSVEHHSPFARMSFGMKGRVCITRTEMHCRFANGVASPGTRKIISTNIFAAIHARSDMQ
ncbi:hypothetical protein PR048_011394 [Dryococelus australis]|uniref:Uncharacterized protein n=1 Tax=Dryococelus australis TaxID=614101 RepID=A0ABQ9HLG5_9NEOP|nr:hypothetical protein PR048_011394 [Dryococelus australis]